MEELTFRDIIGREEVSFYDVIALRGYLRNKRILITGAGGSIGSEITRQLVNIGVEELLATDRDENALHTLQLSIGGSALFDDERIALLDVRDSVSCNRMFELFRPQITIHAAALKHLSALERQPREALLTNVLGTFNVLNAAKKYDVKNFVNVSTDKAANPKSILGKTKRIAEFLTYAAHNSTGESYNSVRFGNVFASRGSVIETFCFQISKGLPITLTDPEIERYFMSVFEASALVLQTIPSSLVGVFSLEMGNPKLLIEVVKNIMLRLGREVPIAITGLRPGEKLHEDLIADYEILTDSGLPNTYLISGVTAATIENFEIVPVETDVEALSEIARLLTIGGLVGTA